MKEMYLDANSHVNLNKKAMEAYIAFLNSKASHGHPSTLSDPGRQAAIIIEKARSKIADLIGAKQPNQIIFTSTCTSACTWGLQILHNIEKEKKYSAYISPTEHPAVKDSFISIFNSYNKLKINENGKVVDERSFDKVACIHVQNEIGLIQPIQKINSKYIFSDMSQSLGKIPIDVSKMNIDIASFAAHKFGGSMLGFIYLKNTDHWKAFDPGSRYFMDRAGTSDVGGIHTSAIALENAMETLPERTSKMISFKNILEPGLEELGFEIIAKNENRSPNTTFAKVSKNGEAALLLLKLSELGIYIGLGSACGSIYSGGSPLMAALNRPSDGQDYIRISQFGEYSNKEAKMVLEKIKISL